MALNNGQEDGEDEELKWMDLLLYFWIDLMIIYGSSLFLLKDSSGFPERTSP